MVLMRIFIFSEMLQFPTLSVSHSFRNVDVALNIICDTTFNWCIIIFSRKETFGVPTSLVEKLEELNALNTFGFFFLRVNFQADERNQGAE